MLLMIPYSLDEFVAMGQLRVDAHREGKPFWRTFWMGGAMEGGSDDVSKGLLATTSEMSGQAARGMTFPPLLLLSIAIGASLMLTRLTLGTSSTMANSDHMVGALVVTFSIIAFAEVARTVRFINIAFGAWLVVAPWLLDGVASRLAVWSGVISGVLLIALAIPRGRSKTLMQDGTDMSSDNRTSPDPAGNRPVIKTRRRPVKRVLMTVGVLLVLGVFGAAGVIFSGFFNVAATVADSSPLRWMLVTVRENSIKRYARNIQAPPLTDAAQRDRGFRIYRKECVMCHTPVGRTATPMAQGFNPQAPTFEENDMTAAELFWAVDRRLPPGPSPQP